MEYANYQNELRKPYLPETKLVDSLTRLTYQRLTEEVRAAHLLITVKPDALPVDTLAAYNRILEYKGKAEAGEDFGALASTHSDDPSARMNQGDLGYFTAMQMVYPFETAAYSGKPGDLVGPVRTRFGYHLILIKDRQPARGEAEVSHIMLRTGAGKDEQKLRNRIFEIADQAKGGAPWDDLCKQFSEDQNTRNSGGRLRPFGVGAMAAVPEFERVAFSLHTPGEVSDPFQTAYGWHIIRLERKIPLPPFNELAPSLKTRVARDERVQVSRHALLNRLKADFAFEENEPVKRKVFDLADSTLTKGKWSVAAQPETDVIIRISPRTVKANEFLSYARQNQKAVTLTPAMYVAQLYQSFVEEVLNEAFETRLMKTNPEFELLLREYYEGILLFDIMEKEVWNKASQDSAGQLSYFQSHAHQYQAGERAVAEVYSSNSAETMTLFGSQLSAGDTTAVQQWLASKKVRVEAGRYQKADRPIFEAVPWAPGLHPAENKGMYYLARILEILPPGPLTFEEARASVISDYQTFVEKNWITELRAKYPVKINEKGKKYVFQQLVR
jgi:peptidyl-prolyl cis-trans isomerase SurA